MSDKTVADLHEELWDHAYAQALLWLNQLDPDTARSVLDLHDLDVEERGHEADAVRAALMDSVRERWGAKP